MYSIFYRRFISSADQVERVWAPRFFSVFHRDGGLCRPKVAVRLETVRVGGQRVTDVPARDVSVTFGKVSRVGSSKPVSVVTRP